MPRLFALILLLVAPLFAQPHFPTRRLKADRRSAALAAGIEFRAVGLLDGAMTARVRASADGVHWTAWQSAEPESEHSALIYFDTPQRFLEYDRATASEGAFLFIDPGPSPAAVAAPPYVTREQWGCTPAACPVKDLPVYTTPTHLIVHHTATANTATDWAAVVRSIWVLHVQGNGWNDIGYNYLIDPNGVLYEGRAGGDGVLGAHFSGVNGGTMGVSMIGTYSTLPATDAALATLRGMLAWQADKWHIDPLAKQVHASSGLLLDTISGHRDANLSTAASGATECPGNALYTVLPSIRERVAATSELGCPGRVATPNVCAPAEGGTLSIRYDAVCAGTVASSASWLSAGSDGAIHVNVLPNSGARRSAVLQFGDRILSVTQSAAGEGPLPCVTWGGVVSSANDFEGRAVAPGSLISIYGSNLATPEGRSSLSVDGRAATILYASPTQINALLPASTNIGSARAVVTVNGVAGPDAMFSVSEAMPAVFTSDGLAAVAQDGRTWRLNSSSAPAKAGDILVVYLTGAGAPGRASSATLGGRPAELLYLGPAPGFPGLDQANLVVPDGTPWGTAELIVTVGGVPSSPSAIWVSR